MNRTFAQALQQATQSLNGTIGTVRDETRAVRDETRAAIQQQSLQVTQTLGDLQATNSRILEQSRSLDEFQRMLQSPKLRGDFGEFTLEQMLRDLLPSEHYECQASIGSGRVDALIRTPYGALCIDCKFPLDNFRRALQETEGPSRDAAMKQFYSDVKGRIKEIGDRYVLPPQTLDVAFMFVPAENVYYEVIGRPELLHLRPPVPCRAGVAEHDVRLHSGACRRIPRDEDSRGSQASAGDARAARHALRQVPGPLQHGRQTPGQREEPVRARDARRRAVRRNAAGREDWAASKKRSRLSRKSGRSNSTTSLCCFLFTTATRWGPT